MYEPVEDLEPLKVMIIFLKKGNDTVNDVIFKTQMGSFILAITCVPKEVFGI